MTDEQRQLPEKYADTTRYKLLASGAIYDKIAGKIVDNIGGQYTITPATAREMVQVRQERRARAGAIGTIRGAGISIESDAPDEEVENKRLQAIENYHEKVGGLAMDAKSPRGIEGVFPSINRALMGEPPREPVYIPGLGNDPDGSFLLMLYRYVKENGLDRGGAVVDGELSAGEIAPGNSEQRD